MKKFQFKCHLNDLHALYPFLFFITVAVRLVPCSLLSSVQGQGWFPWSTGTVVCQPAGAHLPVNAGISALMGQAGALQDGQGHPFPVRLPPSAGVGPTLLPGGQVLSLVT